jgi:hypothetical protein
VLNIFLIRRKGLDVDALIELKKKVIKDYDRFTRRLGNGYVD